ncbi:MAG TPA: hypothetical protein DCM68_00395, partial [Verrucomicrobia bacterium]|nr:hypothetical protein [Verrucomicrobiota bacterium]
MSNPVPPILKPIGLVADTPPPHTPLKNFLEERLRRTVDDQSCWIPARWHPIRRQLAYLERALFCLRRRKRYGAFVCIQQFIALYACYLARLMRLSIPPLFLQPLIYVPRPGFFGRAWRHFFARALAHPSLRIAFCHSQTEVESYQQLFPAAAGKFRHLPFTIDPLDPPSSPADPPYLFS